MQLFTPEEVAKFLKIPLDGLQELVEKQKIGFVRVGNEIRFRCDHVVRFIRKHTQGNGKEWLQ